MKLKASVDYGIRALVYLAKKDSTCSSREISEEMAVPRDYLIQLALRLRNAGLIQARPGKNGGYVLGKSPSEITVRQIMDAFENETKPARHSMRATKRNKETVETVRAGQAFILDSFNSYLSCLTLQNLLDAQASKKANSLAIADSLEQEAEKLRAKVK